MAIGGMAFSIILCIMIWCIWAFCISISSTMSTYKIHIHIETYEYRETQIRYIYIYKILVAYPL